MSAEILPAVLLKRKAVVYVRQSTQTQVQTNLESQRRQYDLVEVARRHGFVNIEVIDDDLGRSASGSVDRPGFERLVASVCAGDVGAVLCFDASRLSRNGRDWHHLLELCGLVQARVIDMDGVYDPCRPNDRLLLGMKGSISEFELSVIRSRMLDAKHGKAQRGELRISVPIGYIWHREIGLGFDPDLRVQEAVRVIFARFRQHGSARQVLLSLAAEQMHFPRPSDGKKLVSFEWTPIRYRSVISILKNPFYAGAYAYGKSQKRTALIEGRARTTYKHRKPFDQWEVIIKEHHEGYIEWSEFGRSHEKIVRIGRIPRIKLLCFQRFENDVHNEPPFALGRKNWLHVGSVQAGSKIAAILSIIESCRRLGGPVKPYLADMLPGLNARTLSQLTNLTPARWSAAHS